MNNGREAILFATHKINEFILSQYCTLKKSTTEQNDLFLLLEDDERIKMRLPGDVQSYTFSVDTLNELQYEPIAETIIPGSNHFSVLQFYRDFPNYDYYWNIEYDVYFHGEWNAFFNAFENVDADFISSHIEYFRQRPLWSWWRSLHLKTLSIPQSEYIKSFNPIYRVSNKALSYLHQVLYDKNSGHHEALISTVLHNAGFSLFDCGGLGYFTPIEFKNRLYYSQPLTDDYYTSVLSILK
jgi:hypothetical protein